MSVRCLAAFIFFFFSSRRRHTRFDCDWSSDVCSSDLATLLSCVDGATFDHAEAVRREIATRPAAAVPHDASEGADLQAPRHAAEQRTHGGVATVAVREPCAAPAPGDRPARRRRHVEAQLDGIYRQILAYQTRGLVERRAGVTDAHRGIARWAQPEAELGGERCTPGPNVRLYPPCPQAGAQNGAVAHRRHEVATRPITRAVARLVGGMSPAPPHRAA